MKHLLWFALAALLLSAVVVAAEDEAPMKKSDLPEAVCKAFENSYPEAIVTGFDKEVDKEQTLYEIETKVGEFERDYVYLQDGVLLQIEEGVSVKSLPEVIVESVKKAHPDGEIDEAEKITRGSTVEYELIVEVGEKEHELLVSSDGKIVSSQQPDDEADADDKDTDDEDDEDDDKGSDDDEDAGDDEEDD